MNFHRKYFEIRNMTIIEYIFKNFHELRMFANQWILMSLTKYENIAIPNLWIKIIIFDNCDIFTKCQLLEMKGLKQLQS